MRTYIVNTNKGEIRLKALSYMDAESKARSAGYIVHSGTREAFDHEDFGSSSNFGGISIDPMDGDLAFGIGGGLTIDSDGDLGIQIAPGISLDFDD